MKLSQDKKTSVNFCLAGEPQAQPREAEEAGVGLDPASVRGLEVGLGQPWASQVPVSHSISYILVPPP